MPIILNNRGRLVDQINGINGVAVGGTASVNLPVNQRYHRITLFCTDGGVAVAAASVITNVRILVNGVVIRDLATTDLMKLCFLNGYIPRLGELPLFFTEPFLTGGQINEPSDVTAWDMFGQSTFQIQLTISGSATTPAVTGWSEFDFIENAVDKDGVKVLQIVSQKSFSYPTAAAQNTITTQPINFPIRRILMRVGAGTITQIQAKQDGNIVANFQTLEQMKQAYRQYGFKFQQEDFIQFQNATGPAALSVYPTLETPSYFGGALIFDVDARLWKDLKVAQNLLLYITTSNATTLTLVQESVPRAYAS
jgi:hypothetical protein